MQVVRPLVSAVLVERHSEAHDVRLVVWFEALSILDCRDEVVQICNRIESPSSETQLVEEVVQVLAHHCVLGDDCHVSTFLSRSSIRDFVAILHDHNFVCFQSVDVCHNTVEIGFVISKGVRDTVLEQERQLDIKPRIVQVGFSILADGIPLGEHPEPSQYKRRSNCEPNLENHVSYAPSPAEPVFPEEHVELAEVRHQKLIRVLTNICIRAVKTHQL